MQEKLRLDHSPRKIWEEDALNAVGATTSLTLRTTEGAPGANDAYVKKYGGAYEITNVIGCVVNIPRGAGTQLDYRIYAEDGTLLGTCTDNGASAYVDGAALASPQRIYIRLSMPGPNPPGGPTAGDTITLTTDVDAALVLPLSGETVSPTTTITWWVASSGSMYYDALYKYGGARHAPVLASAKYPYFDVLTGWNAMVGAGGTIVEILDSETYEVVSATPEMTLAAATKNVQASLGQTPVLTQANGARITRNVTAVYANHNAIFFNASGSDVDTGEWQNPMLTLGAAWAAAVVAGFTCVYGGDGATETAIFLESMLINNATDIEADWEYRPQVINDGLSAITLDFTTAATIRGLEIGGSAQSHVRGNAATATVRDCTLHDGGNILVTLNGGAAGIDVQTSRIYNCASGVTANGVSRLDVNWCDIYSGRSGIDIASNVNAGAITNNVFRDLIDAGVEIRDPGDQTGSFDNNLCYNCGDGILVTTVGAGVAITATADDWIFDSCSTGIACDLPSTIIANFCCFNNNGADVGTGVTNNNPIADDPLLSSPSGGHYGLSAGSAAYHADGGNGDVGPLRRIVISGADDIVFNGLIFDGQDSWFVGLGQDQTRLRNHAKWCSFRGLAGIARDDFATASPSTDVLNCLFRDNGSAVVFAYGGGDLQETLCFDHDRIVVFVDQTLTNIIHCTIADGTIGLYLDTNASAVTVRDSIFDNQSLFGVDAVPAVTLTYCCIIGNVGANVDTSDPSNIFDQPFFIDTDEGEEDFHLRTFEGGYPFESSCKDAASDGYDIGAYLIDRELIVDFWDTYEVECNPSTMPEKEAAKGTVRFQTAEGSGKIGAVSHRRQFTVRWAADRAVGPRTGENIQRKMLAYLSSLVQTDENGLDSRGGLFRLHFRPREYMYPGVVMTKAQMCALPTHGTAVPGEIDATDATIETAIDFVWNEHKGFAATCRWTALYNNGVVDATAKTVTSAGAGWTIDEWIGYDIRQGQYYVTVLSNTAAVLTVSDPENRLVTDAAGFEFYLQSNHKVLRNDRWFHYLEDADGLLRSGTYDWFIDFIVCRLTDSSIEILRNLGYREDRARQVPAMLKFEEAGLCP